MDPSGSSGVRPFGSALIRWKAIGGAELADGTVVTKPSELIRAELILNMLERFGGYTYKTLMEEDSALLKLIQIEQMGSRERDDQYH